MEDVAAKDPMPPFRASVMDGYAINDAKEGDVLEVVDRKGFAGVSSDDL